MARGKRKGAKAMLTPKGEKAHADRQRAKGHSAALTAARRKERHSIEHRLRHGEMEGVYLGHVIPGHLSSKLARIIQSVHALPLHTLMRGY